MLRRFTLAKQQQVLAPSYTWAQFAQTNCCIFLFIMLFITESVILISSSFSCETTSTANMHVSLSVCVHARVHVCVCVCLWLLNALCFLTVVVNLIRVSRCYRHSCSKSSRLTLNTSCFLLSWSGTETKGWTLLKDHRPFRENKQTALRVRDENRKSEVCAASCENEHPGWPPGFSIKHHLQHHVIVQPLPCDALCSILATHHKDNIKSSATKKRLFSMENRTHAHHSPPLALLCSMPPLSETGSNTDGHPANPGHLCTTETRVQVFTWWCFVSSYSLLHSEV